MAMAMYEVDSDYRIEAQLGIPGVSWVVERSGIQNSYLSTE